MKIKIIGNSERKWKQNKGRNPKLKNFKKKLRTIKKIVWNWIKHEAKERGTGKKGIRQDFI
jgi:hypothetical protein